MCHLMHHNNHLLANNRTALYILCLTTAINKNPSPSPIRPRKHMPPLISSTVKEELSPSSAYITTATYQLLRRHNPLCAPQVSSQTSTKPPLFPIMKDHHCSSANTTSQPFMCAACVITIIGQKSSRLLCKIIVSHS